jgi:argininosuccinate synthase
MRKLYGAHRGAPLWLAPRQEFSAVTKSGVKKVVLAYSGGLDTSIILQWLKDTYGCEIVTFTADLGQGEELEPAREKALKMGVKPENIFIDDLREEFVRDFVWPMFRANTLYEGQYLLGTSIARPLIAKRQIEIANMVGADAVCHGATGKGNDQVRFEVSYYALKPDVKVIAPWREWEFEGRPALLDYARKHNIPIAKGKEQEAPFSIDANLLHTSSEGLVLEDPDVEVPDIVSKRADRRTITPEEAPDQAETIKLTFERGDLVAINGKPMKAHELLAELNRLGAKHGVGGLDLVENRYVGMKSRGYYETPGGTILWYGHRAIEQITLDRGAAHLKDELMPKYASLIYNGFWWTPERVMLQAAIDASQDSVSGDVKLKLYKGGVRTVGRSSPYSLYSKKLVGFDEAGGYNQADAEGFIKLNALRLRILAERDKKRGKNE